MAFLVLTIAAERLEILRFQRFSPFERAWGGFAFCAVMAGPALVLPAPQIGTRVLGVGMFLGAAWLARRDIALRTVRTYGVARFAAIGVLSAYGWLAIAGLLLVTLGLGSTTLRYDAVVHAFFIGFVFGAIMAHEPIIVPAVTGLSFTYTPVFYVPLVLLHGTLLVRLAADLASEQAARRWAGLIQAIALALFLILSAGAVIAPRFARSALQSSPLRR
jgi:hypothetical protein